MTYTLKSLEDQYAQKAVDLRFRLVDGTELFANLLGKIDRGPKRSSDDQQIEESEPQVGVLGAE